MAKRNDRVVLSIPSTNEFIITGVRCIRAYFVQRWSGTLKLRGIDFAGIPKLYDEPDRKNCVWYEIYEFAKLHKLNPLWAVDYVIRRAQMNMREVNVYACVREDIVPTFVTHGGLLYRERDTAVRAAVVHLENTIPTLMYTLNMTASAAVSEIVSRAGTDPVVTLIAKYLVSCPIDKDLLMLARLSYAASPHVYKLDKSHMSKFILADWFNWVTYEHEAVDISNMTFLKQG